VTGAGRDSGALSAGAPSGPDFRRLFEGAPGLYLVLDPQLTIVAVSNAFLAATITTRENILGRNVSEVFPDNPDDPEATGTAILTASLDRVRRELRPDTMPVLQYDVRRSAAEGGGFEVRYWSSRNNPMLDPRGKLAHILHEVVDVTEFVRHEGGDKRLTEEFWADTGQMRAEILRRSAELAETNQALREANANRQQFLASMSHELRTPMNAVIGLAELLGNTPLSTPQRRYVDGIRTAGHTLLTVISDVLDVSKIEAGKLVLSAIDFSPAAVVEDVVEMVAESARSKNLEVTGAYAPSLPATRSGDPDRLRQVLLNLAGNAVKFTERGQIHVRAAPDKADPAQGVLAEVAAIRFEVTDTGIGISPDIQQRLFEPFVQADPSTTRRAGGTGLGLAICRELVTLMGGTIGVSSLPGLGSTFWCVIPFPPASQADHTVSLNVLAGLRVLVVDDNSTNRLILDQQLRAWRADTTLCEDAEAALPLLRGAAFHGQRPYQLSILDLRMPGTDGLALADAIHADRGIPDHPMIMLSSEVDFDQAAADHAGISAVLVKPIRGADLFAKISDVMGLAGPTAPASATVPGAAAPASTGRQCGRVLLVEDDELSQLAGGGILTQLGYQVELASDGEQAVAMATARRYDAIIMDCHMPVMDGYTAARAIHAAEGHRHTPIIALTAAALPEDRARCAAATMDDYLTKPITTGKVDAHLRRWIHPGEGAANERREDAAAGGSAQRLSDAISGRLGQFLGDDGLADQLLAGRMLRSVLESFPGKLADLEQSLQQRDVPRLASTAHTLKGMCQNIGATDLADLCDELPAHARAGRDREAAQALTRVEAAGQQVLAATTALLSRGSAPHPTER
jgi:two-component system sensor histidine kinase/response regulator